MIALNSCHEVNGVKRRQCVMDAYLRTPRSENTGSALPLIFITAIPISTLCSYCFHKCHTPIMPVIKSKKNTLIEKKIIAKYTRISLYCVHVCFAHKPRAIAVFICIFTINCLYIIGYLCIIGV